MNRKNVIFPFIMIILSSNLAQNIYNDGTAWKMPRGLKVSDFYKNENTIQYDGRVQEYMVKVKAFYWKNKNDTNHTIESAFFLTKHYDSGGGPEYRFTYRRYITIAGEEPRSDRIRKMWSGLNKIRRGSTLYLSDSNDQRFVFGSADMYGWSCDDGLYENHTFTMYFHEYYSARLLDQLINNSTQFSFYFPSENLETNGIDLELSELNGIKKDGIFPELDNNSFSLSSAELINLKKGAKVLMMQKRMKPKEYIDKMKDVILK